jgi:hypothetical protein
MDIGGKTVNEFMRLGDDGGLFDRLEAINFTLLLRNEFSLSSESKGKENRESCSAPDQCRKGYGQNPALPK